MIINHNMNAMNSHRNMGMNTVNSGKSMEKLSSGLRINRAGDDAAGLAISEKMRGQIRGLDQATRNSQDGISMIQTAEGALNETHSILQRMRELATQASNDTNTTTDRTEIQKEMNQLTSEINRIGNTTEFNTQKLLNGNKAGSASTGAAVAAVKGQFEITVDKTAGKTLIVDGKTFTFDATSGGANQIKDDLSDAKTVLEGALSDYTVTVAAGKLTFEQKAGADKVSLGVTGTGFTSENVIKKGVTAKAAGDATDGKATLQIGANQNQSFTVEIGDMRSKALGIAGITASATAPGIDTTDVVAGATFTTGTDNNLTDVSSTGTPEYALDVTSNTKASAAIKVIDKAMEKVSSERSKLGAYQNRLEHTIANLGTSAENLQAAESRVRDVDMAKEMMQFSKNNILNQASQAMLAQAKSQPEAVLQLLR